MVPPVGSLVQAHLCLHGKHYPLIDVSPADGEIFRGPKTIVARRIKICQDVVENIFAIITWGVKQYRVGWLCDMVDPRNIAESLNLDVMGISPPEVGYASVMIVGLVRNLSLGPCHVFQHVVALADEREVARRPPGLLFSSPESGMVEVAPGLRSAEIGVGIIPNRNSGESRKVIFQHAISKHLQVSLGREIAACIDFVRGLLSEEV